MTSQKKSLEDDFIEFLLSQFPEKLEKDLLRLIIKNPSDNEKVIKELIKILDQDKE